ncbi:MAG: ABC transporter permease [Candidatus Kerfeldbacteria bacterium]
MKFSYINKLNIKKLKKYKAKSSFLIIPITFLMAIGILVSSQAGNIMEASEEVIFGTAAEQGKFIALTPDQGDSEHNFRSLFGGDAEYLESDLDIINAIPNVEAAGLPVRLPIDQVVTEDLFEDVSLNINNIQVISEDLAGQYTDQDFSHEDGEPIPIILNANGFIRNFEDWGGQDEFTLEFTGMRQGGNREAIEAQLPFKTEALTYDRDDMLGQEFTIQFGGFTPVQTYEQEFATSGVLYRNLTEEQIQVNEDQRRNDLNSYWDYDELNTPIEYTFKVVGVIEEEGIYSNYIPSTFATQLVEDYIQKQLDSRNDTEIAVDDLNNIYNGLTFDGLELSGGGSVGIGSVKIGGGGMGLFSGTTDEEEEVVATYTIPGLVINTERVEGDTDAFSQRMFGSSATPLGEYTDPTVFEQSVYKASAILIKVNDIENRAQVVTDLNDAGYAYQDLNDQEVFAELQASLNYATSIVTISFIILTAVIIILTMGKFVSESRKEIGVFRAIGATKGDIKKLFMSQALLYTLIGYIVGSLLGISLVLLSAKPVQLWFDSFIDNTVDETFAVVQTTNAGIFAQVDWQMLGIYTLLLLVISLTISLIPATRASRVSPVQAIKNE